MIEMGCEFFYLCLTVQILAKIKSDLLKQYTKVNLPGGFRRTLGLHDE